MHYSHTTTLYFSTYITIHLLAIHKCTTSFHMHITFTQALHLPVTPIATTSLSLLLHWQQYTGTPLTYKHTCMLSATCTLSAQCNELGRLPNYYTLMPIKPPVCLFIFILAHSSIYLLYISRQPCAIHLVVDNGLIYLN
jgi:hypothetical protein